VRRTPAQLLWAIEHSDQGLAAQYHDWKSTRSAAAASRIQQLAGAVQADLAEVLERGDISEDELRRARMLALGAFFVSAEMLRDKFSPAFLDHCQRLLEDDLNAGQSKKVTLLRFYHQMQVDQSEKDQLLARLREFSREHHTADVGVPLYLVVAQDLATQGRRDSAKAVLKQGMSVYHGQPEASRLVNELINLNL
jgi:hypothetical protein